MREEIIKKLMENADKIFFYCVKRCNSRSDAEDLSQDILLDILVNINKGIEIKNFDYYIWKVCKNHFSKYIINKVIERDTINYYEDINEPADNINILDNLVNQEEITIINSSIKLLSADYANILYSYYVEDRTLSFIANELNLPLGTVKRRLFDIRNKLKEYLKMERLNGKKTFMPEYYSFSASGTDFTTSPHDGVDSLLSMNILIHSFNNPCSLEDYSLELGISLPYVKDFVKKLEKHYLIKKIGDKYVTNFLIFNKEVILQIMSKQLENNLIISNALINFINNNQELIKEFGKKYTNISIDKKLWIISLKLINMLLYKEKREYTLRGDGSKWNFIGQEQFDERSKNLFFIGVDSNQDINGSLAYWEIYKNELISKLITFGEINSNLINIEFIINNINLGYKELSKNKELCDCIKQLVDKQLLIVNNDKIIFNFLVYDKIELEILKKEFENSKEYSIIDDELKKTYNEVKNILLEYSPIYLYEEVENAVDTFMCNYRCFLIKQLMDNKQLYFDLDDSIFTYNIEYMKK